MQYKPKIQRIEKGDKNKLFDFLQMVRVQSESGRQMAYIFTPKPIKRIDFPRQIDSLSKESKSNLLISINQASSQINN